MTMQPNLIQPWQGQGVARPPEKRMARMLVGCLAGMLAGHVCAGPVSFRTEVMPVLSKAGCNLGTCHGNANGKAGFKLSLRGQDPGLDHLALTRDMFARRTNPTDPDGSLILLKATTQVAHEGGVRFTRDGAEYQTLRQWIAQGAADDAKTAPKLIRLEVSPTHRILVGPPFEVPLDVRAVFSTGEARDVSSRAVYEPSATFVQVSADGRARSERFGEATVVVRFLEEQVPVRLAFVPNRPGFVWSQPPVNNLVDTLVFAKLKSLRTQPSGLCTDQEFVRRAHLDLLGLLPAAEEAKAFAADARPDKRARLIDALLERPEFADFWALKWSDLLRIEEKALDRKGAQAFHHWIRESLAVNKPMDQFVREVVASRGSTYQSPPASFYRALRDPIDRAEATAQLFLGTRLRCAKCHNHPFDRWTQADYYDWASVFSRVQYKILQNDRRDNLDTHEFIGEQIVWMARNGSVTNPKTGRAAASRFLDMSDMEPDADRSLGRRWKESRPDPDRDPLVSMAQWLTSPDNPLFARSQVNRIWFHLMGQGIVVPIDDFRPTNPPSNPELLDALTRAFVASGFDLRHVIRLIMNARVYQLSAEPNDTNAEDTSNFSKALIRRLTAEQLLDAQCQVLEVAPAFKGYPRGIRASQIPGAKAPGKRDRNPTGGDQFLRLFGKPDRLLTCECERSDETTMSQAFHLISGPNINAILTDPDNRLERLVDSKIPMEKAVDELYWAALSRPPLDRERAQALAAIQAGSDARAGLEDVAWALLNAKEFVLRK